MKLFRFEGNLCKWPDFIQNFKACVHDKGSFTDNICMEQLLSMLSGEVKRTVFSVERNGISMSWLLILRKINLELQISNIFEIKNRF